MFSDIKNKKQKKMENAGKQSSDNTDVQRFEASLQNSHMILTYCSLSLSRYVAVGNFDSHAVDDSAKLQLETNRRNG